MKLLIPCWCFFFSSILCVESFLFILFNAGWYAFYKFVTHCVRALISFFFFIFCSFIPLVFLYLHSSCVHVCGELMSMSADDMHVTYQWHAGINQSDCAWIFIFIRLGLIFWYTKKTTLYIFICMECVYYFLSPVVSLMIGKFCVRRAILWGFSVRSTRWKAWKERILTSLKWLLLFHKRIKRFVCSSFLSLSFACKYLLSGNCNICKAIGSRLLYCNTVFFSCFICLGCSLLTSS